jgi:predicted nucleotide-binding protein
VGLLQEIQTAAVKADGEIMELLRQCKILAVRLGNKEFKEWVEWELNGFPSTDVLPSYRVLNVQSYGHFAGPFQTELRNAPLPPSCLPEPHRHIANTAYLVESAGVYAALVKRGNSSLQSPWPADAVRAFGEDFYNNLTCLEAWQQFSRGTLIAVIDTIKNRILSFALDLESEDPRAGDFPSEGATLAAERVRHLFDQQIRRASKVFIGHGRSHLWKDLRHFLTNRLFIECDDFNREQVAGRSTKERLEEMLETAVFAFLVMTGEDEQTDGTLHARDNVVHEVGLFQGRLGFMKAIILLEDGCSRFSNIDGLTYIPFPKGNIEAASEEIRQVLEREGFKGKSADPTLAR